MSPVSDDEYILKPDGFIYFNGGPDDNKFDPVDHPEFRCLTEKQTKTMLQEFELHLNIAFRRGQHRKVEPKCPYCGTDTHKTGDHTKRQTQ